VSLPYPDRDEFLEGIHRAQFKAPPADFRALTAEEVEAIRRDPNDGELLITQERAHAPRRRCRTSWPSTERVEPPIARS
jgi:hypothetical protein